MATGRDVKAGGAYIDIFTKDSKLSQGLRAWGAKFKRWGAGMQSIGVRVLAAGTAAIAPLALSARTFANYGDEIEKTATRTRISAETISELTFALELSDASLDDFSRAMKDLNESVVRAGEGAKTDALAFGYLGLATEDLLAMTPEDRMNAVADALLRIPNDAERGAAGVAILGRGFLKLAPLMAEGSEGIRKLRENARELGLTMSTEEAAAAAKFKDDMSRVFAVLTRGRFIIGGLVAKEIEQFRAALQRLLVGGNKWLAQNGDTVRSYMRIALVTVGLGGALLGLGFALRIVGVSLMGFRLIVTGVGGAIHLFTAALATAKAASLGLGAFLAGPWGLLAVVVAAAVGLVLYKTGALGSAVGWLSRVFGVLKDDAMTAWGGIRDALASGDISTALKIVGTLLQLEWARVWGGIKLIHGNAIGALGRMWFALVAGLKTAWEGFTNFFAKLFTRVWGFFDKSFNVDAALAGLDQVHTAAMENIGAELDAKIKASTETDKAAQAARAAEIARLKKELDELREKARAAAKESPLGKPDGKDTPGFGGGAPAAAAMERQFASAMTFSTRAAQGLGIGSNLQERIAKGVEDTVDILTQLRNRATDGGGLAFE